MKLSGPVKNLLITSAYVAILLAGGLSLWSVGSRIKTRKVPVGSIEVTTKYSTYLLGDDIDFTVKNNFNSTVYIENNCPSEPLEVYRLVDASWVRIHDISDTKKCDNEDRRVSIPPNGEQSSSFSSWPKLFDTPGKYRIVVYVQYFNQVPYRDFEVIAKPDIPEIPALLPIPKQVVVGTSKTYSASNTSTGSSSGGSTSAGGTTTSAPENHTTSKSVAQGGISIVYSATAIVSVTITPAAGYTYEINNGSTLRQVTFKKTGGGETQYNIRLSGGVLTLNLAD